MNFLTDPHHLSQNQNPNPRRNQDIRGFSFVDVLALENRWREEMRKENEQGVSH